MFDVFRVFSNVHGTIDYQYLDVNHDLGPWARSMILQYDDA